MRWSSIRTLFQIVGAAIFLFTVLLFLFILGTFNEVHPLATLGMLLFALLMVGVSIYLLAGAPRWVSALHHRFPQEQAYRRVTASPRHKLKASIGIAWGTILVLVMWLSLFSPVLSKASENAIALMIPLFMLSPAAAIWGAVHLAKHRGIRLAIPLAVAAAGIPIFYLSALMGMTGPVAMYIALTLVSLGPAAIVMLLPGRRRRDSYGSPKPSLERSNIHSN